MEEKKELKVEGLGENTVPKVEGMNTDITSVPTPTPKPVEQKIDVTATPTVAPAQPVQKIDVTAAPTVSQTQTQAKIDPSATPTATGAGKPSGTDYSLILKIAAGVFAFAAVVIIIVSIFGGKKLVCTETDEFLGAKTETKYTIKFDGDDKVKSIKMEVKEDYSNSSIYGSEDDSYFDKKLEEETKNLKADNLKFRREGKVLYITYEYNDEKLKSYTSTSYDSMKKMMETTGATCSNK
jgi:hypothetical protein